MAEVYIVLISHRGAGHTEINRRLFGLLGFIGFIGLLGLLEFIGLFGFVEKKEKYLCSPRPPCEQAESGGSV